MRKTAIVTGILVWFLSFSDRRVGAQSSGAQPARESADGSSAPMNYTASAPGKWFEKGVGNSIEINSDGTFTLRQGGKSYGGYYKIQGDTLTTQFWNAPNPVKAAAGSFRFKGAAMLGIAHGEEWQKEGAPPVSEPNRVPDTARNVVAEPQKPVQQNTANEAIPRAPIKEPEYLGTFFLLDSKTGNLSPLEREPLEQEAKIRALGFGGIKSSMQIRGENSPLRFKEGQKLEFVVRATSQQIDPQGLVQLFTLESDDGMRKMATASLGLGGGSSVLSEGSIAFDAAKYGSSSFKISPSQPLPTGEYTLIGSGSKDGFCFGIDADPSHPTPPVEAIVSFQTGQEIPLGLVDVFVTIPSIEVTSWPKAEAIRAAASLPNSESSVTVKCNYSNRGRQDWKCHYQVAILDDKGQEIGSAEKNTNLDKHDTGSNRISVKIRMADFSRAAKIRVRIVAHPK